MIGFILGLVVGFLLGVIIICMFKICEDGGEDDE